MKSIIEFAKEFRLPVMFGLCALVVSGAVVAKMGMKSSDCDTYQEVTGYETKMEGRHCYANKDGQWDIVRFR